MKKERITELDPDPSRRFYNIAKDLYTGGYIY